MLSNAGGTAPHANSRDLAIDAQVNLLESDDGGIYRLMNPGSSGRRWIAETGDLNVHEVNSVAYNPHIKGFVAGTQDTGSPEQTLQEFGLAYRGGTKGDGGIVAVDDVTTLGSTYVYLSIPQLKTFIRQTFDYSGRQVGPDANVGLRVNSAGGARLNQVDSTPQKNPTFDTTLQFVNPYVRNALHPSRMLIGTSFLYESTDRGETLTALGAQTSANPGTNLGPISAMAYGGISGGVANEALIYAASGTTLYVRTSGTGLPTKVT